MFTLPLHHTINHFAGKKAQEFLEGDLKNSQLAILNELLSASSETIWGKEKGLHRKMSYDEFSQTLSPSSWKDWEALIAKQRSSREDVICNQIQSYQPTSGSIHERKWIPYSKKFLSELNSALMVWMHDMYREFPKTKRGKHYWSLSWLPQDLRQTVNNDDLKLLGRMQELLLRPVMAVPASVQEAKTIEESTLLTLIHLVNAKDLSFLSVWSPTFLLSLLSELHKNRKIISQHITDKKIRNLLLSADPLPDLCQRLWPNLALISAWDSAESRTWANEIRNLFPNVPLQGKGLMATEGVVTFPFKKSHILAYQSHFYEFLWKDQILPSWELKTGMSVEPLLSTGSGLFRYHLPDKMEVTGSINGIPTLKFLGRMGGVDLAGEKFDREMIRHYFEELRLLSSETHPVTLLALQNDQGRPGYLLVVKKTMPQIDYERPLLKIHHYRLARELKQLKPLRVLEIDDDQSFWRKLARMRSMVEGDQKADYLIRVNSWN